MAADRPAAADAADRWSLSIVSHGHGDSVRRLLGDLAAQLDPSRFEVIVTLNASGEAPIEAGAWRGPFRLLRNPSPLGFAANHNRALAAASGEFVATCDPDLRLTADPFPALAAALRGAGPRLASVPVTDSGGRIQDNARRVLTPGSLLRRYLLRRPEAYVEVRELQPVAWVAGLFIAARRAHFAALGGFDERFHLYCEDAELCLRCWNAGGDVVVVPAGGVVHDPRRRTRRDLAHLRWHCASLARLWTGETYRRYRAAPRVREARA